MANRLRGKRVLVTAGPTWVALDAVRVLGNVSTGRMGLSCAQLAASRGARVDLFLGPACLKSGWKKFRVFRFTYLDQLKALIEKRLKEVSYDVIIHAAAVSDYQAPCLAGKISSRRKTLTLRLRRAPKLISIMRRLNPGAFLVMFKLEAGVTDAVLLKRAVEAMKKTGSDLAVANQWDGAAYHGFVVGADGASRRRSSRAAVAQELFQRLEKVLRT